MREKREARARERKRAKRRKREGEKGQLSQHPHSSALPESSFSWPLFVLRSYISLSLIRSNILSIEANTNLIRNGKYIKIHFAIFYSAVQQLVYFCAILSLSFIALSFAFLVVVLTKWFYNKNISQLLTSIRRNNYHYGYYYCRKTATIQCSTALYAV